MSERLPVEVVFFGEPFDRKAILHTLRHLAMRVGWTFRPSAEHRLIYATTDNPLEIPVRGGDLIVLSSSTVKRFMTESQASLPLTVASSPPLPFSHPKANDFHQQGWINADVIAGAHALFNLFYERRTRPETKDGWIRFQEDWWTKAGFTKPEPLADLWLDGIATEAEKIGWPRIRKGEREGANDLPATVLLTHDVDYLPTFINRGIPRFVRALLRQLLIRKRVRDAQQIIGKYRTVFFQSMPYDELRSISSAEAELGVTSSFQFAVRRSHRSDPPYDLRKQHRAADALRYLAHRGFEICLHGSYTAARTQGQLAEEKGELEHISGVSISGHRQHYLNFHPITFFSELEKAGFNYDMSVGYNDISGPRAGTLFPFRPYDVEKGTPFSLWEIPFIMMDTTLATTYKFSSDQSLEHCMDHIRHLEKTRGCVSMIWHQEELSGLLDPGFDTLYWTLLKRSREHGLRLTSGHRILPELDALWKRTIGE